MVIVSIGVLQSQQSNVHSLLAIHICEIVRRILAFPGLHNIGFEVTSTCSGKRAVESAQFEINRSLGLSFILKQNMLNPGTEI